METSEIVWKAYDEGFDGWRQYVDSDWKKMARNPYENLSMEWRSWNIGWNSNCYGEQEFITEKRPKEFKQTKLFA